MLNTKKLTSAIQVALFIGTASLVAGNAFAQTQTEEKKEETKSLDRVEVVGSRVKRAEIEGALPVTVIDRAAIDATGKASVADVLRDTTFASFGNFRPQSGSSAQALADIDLRGLGSSRTLVLIDGRRAPKAPFAAGSQDLNAIPTSAVERIEILSDGASAVYGSDAIGGVVNIVLRKDFEGAELRAGMGMTDVKGGDTHEYAATFGTAGERGRMIMSASANDRGMVFTRDQIGYVQGVSVYGNNYRVYNQNTGAFVTAPTAVPGFACNTNGFWRTAGGTCSFDFNSVAANEASIKNKGLFARGDYQITDNWSVYMTAMAQKVNSFGRYAPVPVLALVADNTPNDIIKGDGLATALYHRMAAGGNRDTSSDANVTDLLLGFQGRVWDKVDLDFGIRRSNYRYNEFGTGYSVNPLLVAALEAGDYLVTDPYGTDPTTLSSVFATINRRSTSTVEEAYATANFDLFEMAGGTSNMAVGVESRKETYADLYDSLSEAGVIDGSAGNSAAGSRKVQSIFAEWLFPIVNSFEVTLAGRYDKYSDYGSDFAPKIGMRWHPVENFTLRGSYGTGFRAPSLDILTQKTSFSADSVVDPATCIIFGGTPAQCQTASVQVDAYYRANPNLSSEQSKQWSLGMAYDPTDWLNFTLDYYNIEIEERIRQFSSQALIDRTNNPALGPIPAGLGVVRNADGSIKQVNAGYGNEGTLNTNGLDLAARTRFDLAGGRMQNMLQIGYVNEYTIDDGEDLAGTVGAPDVRANLSNQYNTGAWTFGTITRYIKGQQDPGATRRVGGYTLNDVYATVKAPWNGDFTIGVNNVGNRYPQLYSYDGRPWNFNLYDAYGRTIYLRYTQKF
ncbi:TonB-dependent receptor [Lysobacter oculi]|uniref:TonB-dependent receptor n=1 Tax=Solilutibacter oculi TaxID=2698682 RepID=A0A344J2Y7_9GAMM|nr:TonB-dependent receptor [Lysobacter oculi]AXA83397.1 TonB-dependent receptor [Lysobacter oculi]